MAGSEFYDALAESLQNVEDQRAQLEAAAAQARQAGTAMAKSAKAPQIIPGTGGETASSWLQKKQGELQAQKLTQKVAAASDIENLMVTLGQDMAALAHQQRAVTDKIAQDSAVSLFEDPLTAIANAFTIPWDEQELAGIQLKMDTTSDHMQKLHSHVQQSAKTADVISTKVTEQSLADVATAAEALQVREAAKARLDAARANADAVTFALSADSKILDLRAKERAAQLDDERMDLARKREERQMEILERQWQDIKDKDESDKIAFEYANAALVKEGKKPLTLENYKMWKGTSAEFLNTLITKGMQLAINGTERYTQGNTIEDRLKWQKTINWTPETPQQDAVMQWQLGAIKQASEMPLADKKQMPAQANNLFLKNFRVGQEDIREGSPFAAPSFSVYANTPEAKNPLWQKYIAPTLDDKSAGNPITPEFVMGVAKQALMDKAMPSKDIARFVSDIFKRSVEINNATHQFYKIAGIEQTKYGARLDVNGRIPGKERVEMTDPVQVQAAIQKQVAIELVGRINWMGKFPVGAKTFREGGDFYPPLTESGVVLGAQ